MTPDQAEKILAANRLNIVKKAAAGKTLTAQEVALIQAAAMDAAPAPAVARTQVELAAVLGVNRKTVREWQRLPGAPKPNADHSLDIVLWRAFVQERGLKGGETTDEVNWRARLLQAQAERVELNNAILRGDYIRKADMKRWVAEIVLAAKNTLLKIPDMAAQTCAGRDAAEISGILKEMVFDALTQLHRKPDGK